MVEGRKRSVTFHAANAYFTAPLRVAANHDDVRCRHFISHFAFRIAVLCGETAL